MKKWTYKQSSFISEQRIMAYLQKIYIRQIRKDGLSHMLHLQQHERPTQNTFKLEERERERGLILRCGWIFEKETFVRSGLKEDPQAACELVYQRPLHCHLRILHLPNYRGLERGAVFSMIMTYIKQLIWEKCDAMKNKLRSSSGTFELSSVF